MSTYKPDHSGGSESSALPTIRVGIVEKNQHSFWDSENAGWNDAAAALGMSVAVAAPNQEDITTQLELMRRHLDSGVDALGFVGTYPQAFTEIVGQATADGVAVVCFDLDAPDSGRALYVGMEDPHTMGRWAADNMASLFGPGAKTIGVLTGSDKAAGAVGKMGGFTERMAELGHRIVGGANDGEDVEVCRANLAQLIEQYPQLDGLYGVYSYHTALMGQAARRLDPKPVVFGWDLIPETIECLSDGSVDMAVWIKEYYFGFYAAAAVANLVRLGLTDGLTVMGLDPVNLSGNRICPPAQIITPATVEHHIAWRRERSLEGRLSRLPT